MTINRLFGVFAITLSLAAAPACGKKGGSDGAKAYSKLVDEACACKSDVACLKGVQEKMQKFDKSKINADDLQKMAADTQRMMKCTQDVANQAGAGAAAAGAGAAAAGADQAAAAAGGDDQAAGGDDKAGDDDKAGGDDKAGDDDGDEGAEGETE